MLLLSADRSEPGEVEVQQEQRKGWLLCPQLQAANGHHVCPPPQIGFIATVPLRDFRFSEETAHIHMYIDEVMKYKQRLVHMLQFIVSKLA